MSWGRCVMFATWETEADKERGKRGNAMKEEGK